MYFKRVSNCDFSFKATLQLCLSGPAWRRYWADVSSSPTLLTTKCRLVAAGGEQKLFDVFTPLAASCSLFKDMASYPNLCNAACLLLLQKKHMLRPIKGRRPSSNVPFSTYSSHSCGKRNVFIHRASAYCSDEMFESAVKGTIWLSASLAVWSGAYVFKMWFSAWTKNVSIPSPSLPCDDLDFKTRRAVRAAAFL